MIDGTCERCGVENVTTRQQMDGQFICQPCSETHYIQPALAEIRECLSVAVLIFQSGLEDGSIHVDRIGLRRETMLKAFDAALHGLSLVSDGKCDFTT